MIEYVSGDMFQAAVEAVVNPVNLEGVMGKGLALQFKRRWPAIMTPYKRACENGTLSIGTVLPVRIASDGNLPAWTICFPTKTTWRQPSKLQYVEDGLYDLRRAIRSIGIRSIAVPALGSGLGGLLWGEVKTKINEVLSDVECRILVYEPQTAARK